MGGLTERLSRRVLLLDGSMGALLGQMGYASPCPDELSVTHPEVIRSVHEKYLEAGADLLIADSFGASEMALSHKKKSGMGEAFTRAAVSLAKRAAGDRALVAVDIGPTSEFMAPVGAREFEAFYDTFLAQARAAKDEGADFAIIETQTDAAECRAACLACADAGFETAASFTFGANGRTLTGSPAECCARMLEAAGAVALGINCSTGPEEMLPTLLKMRAASRLPVMVQPNAGLPVTGADGRVTYPYTPEAMQTAMRAIVAGGASAIGGCCGTTPAHIRALRPLAGGPAPVSAFDGVARVCSARACVSLSDAAQGVCEIADLEDLYDLEDDCQLALIDIRGLSPEAAKELSVEACARTKRPLAFRADSDEALLAALRVYAGVAAVFAPGCADAALARYGALRL